MAARPRGGKDPPFPHVHAASTAIRATLQLNAMDLREIPAGHFRRHPWETVRAAFFRSLLEETVPRGRVGAVLDVGAGDGWTARRLLEPYPNAQAVCWDPNYERDLADGRFRYAREIPGARFDLLLLLDVLEHLDDDRGFLAGLLEEHALPGASVLVSVPAWRGLYCRHDAAFTHRRRYDPADLAKTLRAAGLSIERSGGLFACLLLPRMITVVRERWFPEKRPPEPAPLRWRGGEFSARAAESLLSADAAIDRLAARAGLRAPGLSAWALCRWRGQ